MARRDSAPLRAVLGALACLALPASGASADSAGPTCDPDDAGLALPEGFCGLEVAGDVGPVRNLAVAPNGDVYATLRTRGDEERGGVLALRDTDGDGRADERRRLGRGDGHGIALTDTHVYFAASDRVVRWRREPGELVPAGEPEEIVLGFPAQSSHAVKAIALGPDGALYVEVGAPSNACQREARSEGSPGLDPCPQRALQAGIWRYDARKTGQRHAAEQRFAAGLRHALALAVDPATGHLWAVVNGRDQLRSLWGWSAERNAELPAEEMVHVEEGDDSGWPYCYHDGREGRDVKVLAPEYGGDGEERGRCDDMKPPDLAFPAHWAPMDLHFYRGGRVKRREGSAAAGPRAFPARYAGGAFVAFRGSWNRAPLPQEGYRVAFVPFAEGRPEGGFETFAIGSESPTALRMTGVAEGPDGSLYIAADANQRIWRVLPHAADATP